MEKLLAKVCSEYSTDLQAAFYRLIDPSNNQLVYPSGLQYTPRYGTNYGVLVGIRF
jgi:hypothetical protein